MNEITPSTIVHVRVPLSRKDMKTYQKILIGLAALFLAFVMKAHASDFAFGADLSFLKQAEDHGKVFKDGTNAMPGLQIFRNHGYNWIRLRLFVEPVSNNLPNDLAYTNALAQNAKKMGYKYLLDLHNANSWDDPGKQPTRPAIGSLLSHQDRVQKVFRLLS